MSQVDPEADRPLRFAEVELLQEDDYAKPHIESGRRLHGGLAEDGRYISPRMKQRGPAIESWTAALRDRGGDLLSADASLLTGARYPNDAQSKLLLQEGLGQSFWNSLTITGHIEARGRVLADMTFPDFQEVILEDISSMALGHLNLGLLKAHGLDEGGQPEQGIGGHDEMWFALRDLAFGDVGYPEPVIPENIARPEEHKPPPPPISAPHGQLLDFLMNLLLIEFRAERLFALAETLLRDPELFTERKSEAEHAAEIVNRIRQDENVHVESLRLFLGEARALTFHRVEGGTLMGAEFLDDQWRRMVEWATVIQPPLAVEQQRPLIRARIADHPEAKRVQKAFDALEEVSYDGL